MKIYKKLKLAIKEGEKEVIFGETETVDELKQVYEFRFKEYSRKGYIIPSQFPDNQESDEYDKSRKCKYFVAIVDNKIIGTVRLIITDPLPTESVYHFIEPVEMLKIPRDRRGELGRLIIVPLDREKKIYLPRGLVLLMMLDMLADYGTRNNIQGGYAFIKKSLEQKMKLLRFPFNPIKKFEYIDLATNTIRNYFHQPNDPALPIFYLTVDFKKYISKIIYNPWLFKKEKDNTLILRKNLYSFFLKVLGII
ncbi:MAG: GNAT family N-acyltransferase [bacterium]|nr:GNAT family N-acyltransferase [bacterium]